jgi:outer membrane lipoprotein-sorting protein
MQYLILLLIGAAVQAATPAAPQPDDAALPLETVLARIDGKAASLHSVQALFSQVNYDPIFDEVDESQGVVRLVRTQHPDHQDAPPVYQIRFDYLKPERSVTIVDGSKVIVWTPEMQAPEESHLIDDTKMQSLLAGFVSTERLREHHKVMIDEQHAHEVTLHLVPKTDQARQQFREMRVTFDKRTWLPTTIHHLKLNGDKVTFTFARVRLNTTVPPEQFTAASLAPLMKKVVRSGRPETAGQ